MKLKNIIVTIVAASLFTLSGCEPRVILKPLSEQKTHTPLSVGFDVSWDDSEPVAEPNAIVFNKYDLEDIQPLTVVATPKGSFAYEIKLEPVKAGEYRIVLTVPYRKRFLGIPLGTSKKLIVRDFSVHDNLPTTCYSFDEKDTSTIGWTVSNVYIDDKQEPFGKHSCPGLFYVENSWPWPIDKSSVGGSLFVPVSSDCFPKVSTQALNKTRWRFTISSPDLGEISHWQHIKAIQFRVATKDIPILISPSLTIRNLDAPDKPSSELTTADYEIIGGKWRTIDVPITLTPKTRVEKFNLTVSGFPEQTVNNAVNSIFIDGICPIE